MVSWANLLSRRRNPPPTGRRPRVHPCCRLRSFVHQVRTGQPEYPGGRSVSVARGACTRGETLSHCALATLESGPFSLVRQKYVERSGDAIGVPLLHCASRGCLLCSVGCGKSALRINNELKQTRPLCIHFSMGRTELRAQAAVYHDESVLASFVSPFFILFLSSSYKPLFLPLGIFVSARIDLKSSSSRAAIRFSNSCV